MTADPQVVAVHDAVVAVTGGGAGATDIGGGVDGVDDDIDDMDDMPPPQAFSTARVTAPTSARTQ
jgi:hypothetical protein